MKTFDTDYTGGMPAYLDDLRFMETTHKEVFEAILKPFSLAENVVIITGCEISNVGNIISVTSGWILFNGEAVRFDGQSFQSPSLGNFAYYVVNTVNLVGGNKQFFSGGSKDTWKETVASIEISSSIPPNSLAYDNVKKYWEVSTQNIVYPKWKPLPDSSHLSTSPGVPPRFLKDNSGFVHISGTFSTANPNNLSHIGQLPVGYRPSDDFYFVYTLMGAQHDGFTTEVTIQTDGKIVIAGVPPYFMSLNSFPAFLSI